MGRINAEYRKAMRTTDGTVIIVAPITKPSLDKSEVGSISMVKILEVQGTPHPLYPVGAVTNVPSRALITM